MKINHRENLPKRTFNFFYSMFIHNNLHQDLKCTAYLLNGPFQNLPLVEIT